MAEFSALSTSQAIITLSRKNGGNLNLGVNKRNCHSLHVDICKGQNVTSQFARLETKLTAGTEGEEKFPHAAVTLIVCTQWPQLTYWAEWWWHTTLRIGVTADTLMEIRRHVRMCHIVQMPDLIPAGQMIIFTSTWKWRKSSDRFQWLFSEW
jgi:hypothetical protein